MKNLSFIFLIAAFSLGGSESANAFDAMVDVKITAIEGTYFPTVVPFVADRAVGSCPIGTNLQWVPQGATQDAKDKNAQAVLAMLLTAKSTGSTIKLAIVSATCKIEFIYIN